MTLRALCLLIAAGSAYPASAADLELRVSSVAAEISTDPSDAAWRPAPSVAIPVLPQSALIHPGAVQEVRVQSLSSPTRIYFRLEWEDPAKDDDPSATGGVFDSAALEFPASPESLPTPIPYLGDPKNPLALWVWSSATQREIDEQRRAAGAGTAPGAAGASRRPPATPVESLRARGNGTLKPTASQRIQGRGSWKNGRWRVVLRRGLSGEPPFADRARMYFAVTVWDAGVQGSVGVESVSAWQTLAMPGAPAAPPQDSVAKGRRAYFRYGCAACHGKDGTGGTERIAGGNQMVSLARMKEGYTRAEALQIILNGGVPPKADKPGAKTGLKMNAGSLIGPDEAEAMTDYLFSLMPKEPGQEW